MGIENGVFIEYCMYLHLVHFCSPIHFIQLNLGVKTSLAPK